MVLAVFERMLNHPEKMAYFNQDPVLKATFLACYRYLKAGHSFDELGWFHSREFPQKTVKKAA